ncbi:expressed protein [Echinococcus multilocularis]|uniref:Expressed protein n=1 Tax=Echinococcus multilocularis TaxID=6211 RepID=A0A068XZG6_ECHMU|nr:expressed protein [Echinococcus multilocularis]
MHLVEDTNGSVEKELPEFYKKWQYFCWREDKQQELGMQTHSWTEGGEYGGMGRELDRCEQNAESLNPKSLIMLLNYPSTSTSTHSFIQLIITWHQNTMTPKSALLHAFYVSTSGSSAMGHITTV